MRIRALAVVVLLGGVIGTLPGCGGSSSGTDATAVATPHPPPPPDANEPPPQNPAPPPPCQNCEPPVTNTNPPVRLTIKIYKVQDLNGTLLEGIPPSIPLGYTVTIDATPKDVDNRDTLGSGTVEFTVSDPDLVEIKSNHGFQKKLTILGEGLIEVKASLDGIESNSLVITLG
jgi:hypothetical protein